jgi:uncharacterized protein YjbI with pentapeptide repeats/4-hydroxybenzoate polyprenyltransferase
MNVQSISCIFLRFSALSLYKLLIRMGECPRISKGVQLDTEIPEKRDSPLTRADIEGLLRKVGRIDQLNLSNQNLADIDLSDIDLIGANLSGTNLQGARFKKAARLGTHLDGDLLDWAKVNQVNPSSINLSKADLHNADLRGADLSGANLGGADLSGANLYGANLSEAALIRANLSGAHLSRARLRWATLSGAHLSRADLREADLRRADFRSADLSGAVLVRADLSQANLSGANLRNADLSKADLSQASLGGANLSGAILYGVDLGRIALLWAQLRGAHLGQAGPLVKEGEGDASCEENVLVRNGRESNAPDARDRPLSSSTTPTLSNPGSAGRIRSLASALHSRRWTKSLLVFVGLAFAQQFSFTLSTLARVLLAFVIFCLSSSCIYLLNDLLDLEKDREHPVKRKRPLASGALPASWAIVTMVLLVLLCAVLTFLLFTIPACPLSHHFAPGGDPNILFVLAICSFLLLTVCYNVRLKHIVLLDVFTTSASAFIRILAGAVVVPVSVSPWLSLLTILLVLFFGLGKRRHELGLLLEQASLQRQVLREYSIPLLDHAMTLLIATITTVYSLYILLGSGGNQLLIVTVPLVLYGMLRYLYLVYMRKENGIPEEVLLRDWHLLITLVLCAALILITRYVVPYGM